MGKSDLPYPDMMKGWGPASLLMGALWGWYDLSVPQQSDVAQSESSVAQGLSELSGSYMSLT